MDSNAETLQKHARLMVNGWPPLTPAQKDQLAVLLRGGGK